MWIHSKVQLGTVQGMLEKNGDSDELFTNKVGQCHEADMRREKWNGKGISVLAWYDRQCTVL